MNDSASFSNPLPDLKSVQAEQARRSLRRFIKDSWHVVRPSDPFIPNWHIDAIAEHLQAVYERQIQYLLINIGPGHAKSLLCAVQFPAWLWLKDPSYQLICGTYAHKLTVRDAVRCRDLITSPWYRETFEPNWDLKDDANEKDLYYNDLTGFRCSVSVTGQGTGYRGNGVIYDDILSRDQAHSDADRVRACEWVKQTMSSRRNDLSRDWEVAIGQRLHESDPYGEMIQSGKYELLCLPSEYEPKRRCVTKIGWSDPRTEDGELLFPALFPPAVIAQCKVDLGSYAYAGQHQQRPSPAEGGILKRSWWRYWHPPHIAVPAIQHRMTDGGYQNAVIVPLPEEFDQILQSWDMAFKDKLSSDYVVGQVWGAIKADRFLLDQKRDRLDMPKTAAAVKTMSDKWPKAHRKLVEDKANGPAVISELQHEVPGLIAVNPEGGKMARAQAVSPQVESGNVYLPHPAIAPWVDGFIEECAAFPNAKHDDMVDSASQALNHLRSNNGVLGVIEDLKTQERILAEHATARAVANAAPSQCPKCDSTAVVRIVGNWRCNSCGHQITIVRN